MTIHERINNLDNTIDYTTDIISNVLNYINESQMRNNTFNIAKNLSIKLGDTILIIGPRSSGKTNVIKNLIKAITDNNNNLQPFICVRDTTVDTEFNNIRASRSSFTSNGVLEFITNYTRDSYVVLDDINASILHNHALTKLYQSKNKIKIISTQILIINNINFRNTIDYIFLLESNGVPSLLFGEYGHHYPNLMSFENNYARLTKDYGCMIINNKSNVPLNRQIIQWNPIKIDN